MRKRDVLKLHNEDEVLLKKTGESLRVLHTWKDKRTNSVFLEVIGKQTGWKVLYSQEVK